MDDWEQTIDKVLWIWMTVNRQLIKCYGYG